MKTKSTITIMREYLNGQQTCNLSPRLKEIADGFRNHQKASDVNELLEASKLQPLNVRILPEAVAIFCLNNSLGFDRFVEFNRQAHEMRTKKLLEDDESSVQLLTKQLHCSTSAVYHYAAVPFGQRISYILRTIPTAECVKSKITTFQCLQISFLLLLRLSSFCFEIL